MKLATKTKKELYELARTYDIENRSKLTKEELIEALTVKLMPKAPAVTDQPGYARDETPPAPPAEREPDPVIPNHYGQDTVVLMPVEPSREYAYWELTEATIDAYRKKLEIGGYVVTLKLFQQTEHGVSERATADVPRVGNWFFDVSAAGSTLWAELGITDEKGRFYAILTSARVLMPMDTVSQEIDQETWMTVGKNLEKIYQLSGAGEKLLAGSLHMHEELMKHVTMLGGSSIMAKRGDA